MSSACQTTAAVVRPASLDGSGGFTKTAWETNGVAPRTSGSSRSRRWG